MKWKTLILFVGFLGWLTPPVQAQESSSLPHSGWFMPPAPRTFAEFLISGQDLVVIGTVLDVSETRRGFVRMPELMSCPITEIRLRVEEPMFGSATDSVIDMTLVETGFGLKPGERVLAWGSYTPEDNWRIRGRLLRVDDDQLRGRQGEPAFVDSVGPRESLSLSEVRLGAGSGRHPSTIFNGMRTIALAKLRGSSRWSEAGAVYEVDSLGWVIGQGESVPRIVTFPALPGCFPGIFPGDTLLVPLPPGFRGTVLTLTHCPSALLVKSGFVRGLGTRLSDVNRSLEFVGSMLHVRPVQRKER